MDPKNLKEIIHLFERSSLTRMVIKEKGGSEITLEKQREVAHVEHAPSVMHPPVAVRSAQAPMAPIAKEEPCESDNYHKVKSPMVGTFYRAPSPQDKPYVKEGDHVHADTVVCIIEAMKVMNEVKAGKAGVVKSFHVQDGSAVEFNSHLLSIG
ncbi:MAG: acetyl-CoA carboxylase biotin carboxyl carrier protein [Chlamydiae bacterium]|nr:acetyl-CoA carboxylase biotin carboxyl carrier protein [Chlamydiota bacterium]